MKYPRAILVLRFSSIGDIVQLTSPLKSLRDRFPETRIDVITLDDYAELLIDHPDINRIIHVPRKMKYQELTEIGKMLAAKGYDLIIDLHNVIRSQIIRRQFKTAKKVIYKKPRWKRFKLIELKKNHFPDEFSQRWLYHQCLEELLNDDYLIPKTKLVIQKNEQFEIKLFLEKEGLNGPYITLVPGAAWPQKTWLIDHYKELVNLIVNKLRLSIVIIGSKNDGICGAIANDTSKQILELHGKLDIRESLAIISLGEMTVGSDTGMVHASEALGVPVAMIMGPTNVQTGGGTSLNKSVVIEKDIWCRPCSQNGNRPCYRSKQYCMTKISTSDVYRAIHRVLA
jgi:ADP-heptose:LPS heptosyltransferase